ncbi:MAG: iron chelate uptake ABC transporter family permease subunit [Candidatus Limiplasma sp.]|nr:iron chelate uptake ABC transporter family permease subunit [Candidatus Limiplasma sp.]MEA5145278.1 iron chelate uptake ABC transporter family permease subunit [Candidatus Limiplasma sp.]
MTEQGKGGMWAGYRRRRLRARLVGAVLLVLCAGLCTLMLLKGNTDYPLHTVLAVLQGQTIRGATYAIGTLRLPRMLTGLLAGLAFGMAGSTFQTMLRNPLASPDIIGITSGSSAAAVFCILVLGMGGAAVSAWALVAGLAVAALVYGLSGGGKFSGGRLILIGIGVQAMLGALVNYLLLKAAEYDVANALRWLRGSLNGVDMAGVPPLLLAVLGCGAGILLLTRQLNILELGEDAATTLGLRTHRTRLLLILLSVLLISFATAATGPIAFVAFLAGPIAGRLTGGSAAPPLVAGLTGAVLVLGADLLGQFAFAARYPVGVVTGILGAPYLVFLLIRINRKGGAA